eukprot:EG_transcript_13430
MEECDIPESSTRKTVTIQDESDAWIITEEAIALNEAILRLRRRIKTIVFGIFFIMIPVCIFTLVCTGAARRWITALGHHQTACTISGYCTIMAVASSLWLVGSHMACYTNPPIQQRIIRILLMVPVYACQSWLALTFKEYALYLDLIRDSYESFVIYEFFTLLKCYMGGDVICLEKLRKQPDMQHIFPLCYILGPFRTGSHFLRRIYICLLQYVIIKPGTACLAMVLHSHGLYTEGAFSPRDGYLWVTLIVNVSVTVAFTSLVYFYLATKDLLAEHSPSWKFGIVKGVVFLSFWQSVLVSILIKFHIINGISTWSPDEVGVGLQELLICVEMMLTSIACHYSFSYDPYRPPTGHTVPSPTLVSHAVSPRMMVQGYVSDVSRLLQGHLSRSGMFSEDFAEYAEQLGLNDHYGSFTADHVSPPSHRQWMSWEGSRSG